MKLRTTNPARPTSRPNLTILTFAAVGALAACLVGPARGLAWNAHGHRLVTQLALEGLPEDMPAWLRDPVVQQRVVYQSYEPDRWRSTRIGALHHINKPDHYLDVELLEEFGLTLETVPPLRREYLRAMAIAKHVHPEQVEPYDPAKDEDRANEWPGFALHAIVENYAKLQNAFRSVRILEAIGADDPRQAPALQQARENAIHYMGLMSHFVGDLAQPLHTTKHFNGWVGPNPDGYTTSNRFHAYIDGGVLEHHGLTVETVRPVAHYQRQIQPADPWNAVVAYLRNSFTFVEPLYQMEKDGRLREAPGRELIVGRLADAADMLNALYVGAWRSAVPSPDEIARWRQYDEWDAAAASQPASAAPTSSAAGG